MARIELTDTPKDAIGKLANGNPGAVGVLCELFKETDRIDPDAAMGGFTHLLALDTLGICGPDIWLLYKDICDQDLVKTVAVLRAWQLGFIDASTLKTGLLSRGTIDVTDLVFRVQGKLPNFGVAAS